MAQHVETTRRNSASQKTDLKMNSEDPGKKDLLTVKRMLSAILLGVFLILLVLTNPKEGAHQRAIRDAVEQHTRLASHLGRGVFVATMATYHNYVFFSETTFERRTISIGILGIVWADER